VGRRARWARGGIVRTVNQFGEVLGRVRQQQEKDDHGLRRWLLEPIGEAKSEAAMPLLSTQLNSPDESLRGWAAAGQ
jgi:hypothetical protein